MTREELARRLDNLHAECDIDGYGENGEGYNYDKFIDLLIQDGWKPPHTFMGD